MVTKRLPASPDGTVAGVRQTLEPHPFPIAVSTALRRTRAPVARQPFPQPDHSPSPALSSTPGRGVRAPEPTDKAYRELLCQKKRLEEDLKYTRALLRLYDRPSPGSRPAGATADGKAPGRPLQ